MYYLQLIAHNYRKISLISFLQSRQLHIDLDQTEGEGLSLPSRLPRDLFSIRLSRTRVTGKSRRRLASSTMPPLRPSYRRPFSSAIEPRQCEQWPRRSGVTHAPLNIVADKGAGDVLQTAMRHAPHPPPVKTFRTAAPVCHDDGVSHVPPFVFPETVLGNYEVQPDAVFGNGGARRIDCKAILFRGILRKPLTNFIKYHANCRHLVIFSMFFFF